MGVEVDDGGTAVHVSTGVGVVDALCAVGDWVFDGLSGFRVDSTVVAIRVARVFVEKAGKAEILEQAIKASDKQMNGSKSLRVIESVS